MNPFIDLNDGFPCEPSLRTSQKGKKSPCGGVIPEVWFKLFHLASPFPSNKHSQSAPRRHDLLNSLFDDGKEVVEAQGSEPKGLGFASSFNRAGLKLAKNEIDVTHLSFRNNPLTKLPVRVSALPQRRHVSGGTSPSDRASDPSKRRTRLWTQLAALYGAYGLCETDAINRLTGRLVLDNGHGKVNGDLILCSPTAWYSLGTGNCGRRTIAKGLVNG